MNYAEAIQFLYSLQQFGTRLGLENTFQLSGHFGNPHKKLRFIHVAGTNGKGSTSAFLESIYRHGGYKTGLFTSPHLISFTERIQVNRQPISESEAARLTGEIIQALGGEQPDRWEFQPTFFEFVTILALLHFRATECEIVIWETGLGGRLDATNIVTPLASVITNIQFDHQQWLGNTLAEIAREKAGIIKPGVPVITATRDTTALEVIRETAARFHSPLSVVAAQLTGLELSLKGDHQLWNAAVALEAVRKTAPALPLDFARIPQALTTTAWPGRLQLLDLPRGRVLLDGAHNPDGAATLAESLRKDFAAEQKTFVLGFFRDKSWQAICDLLLPRATRVIFAPVQSPRSESPARLKEYAQKAFPNLPVFDTQSLREAIELAFGFGLVVITGSLHFVGEAMEILEAAPGRSSNRDLNEWDAARIRLDR